MSEEYDIELKKICEKYNIQVLVADGESEAVKYSMNDPRTVLKQLLITFFLVWMKKVFFLNTDEYKMQVVEDYRTQTEYVEMWGMLDNGYLFMLRSALEGIRESVSISNRFLTYVGSGAVLVSVLLVIWLSNRVTKPIMELAKISERMKGLDFEANTRGMTRRRSPILGNNIKRIVGDAAGEWISELRDGKSMKLLKDDREKRPGG